MPVMDGNQATLPQTKDVSAHVDTLAAELLALRKDLKATQSANKSLEESLAKIHTIETDIVKTNGEGIQLGPYADQDWCAEGRKRVEEKSDGLWLTIPSLCINCNPLVTVLATLVLFGFVIFAAAQTVDTHCLSVSAPADSITKVLKETLCSMPNIEFGHWQSWVTETFTWAYIGTQDAWIIFAIVLFFSKYGKLKLGPADEPPDYSTYSWFAMIFSCGVASGLFFYSVAEPIWHFGCGAGKLNADNTWIYSSCAAGASRSGHRYNNLPDNYRAQEAMNLTLYHWGLHGWVCYAMHGALLALLHFRKGLPICTKSCFYPLLGERVYGLCGDIVDVISIVGTTFGVCTSLGLATFQLNDGIKRRNGGQHWMGLGWYGKANLNDWATGDHLDSLKKIYDGAPESYRTKSPWFQTDTTTLNVKTAASIADVVKNNDANIIIIWVITAFSTISLLLGLDYGIQMLGNFTFGLGLFLLWALFMLDDTWYLANLFVQSFGHYVQWITQVGFYTGAFDQAEHSAPDKMGETKGWIGGWTIFYWGWWIAWAPLVGNFIGRISKGRTIREYLVGTVFGSTLFNMIWMVLYGGSGLKMQMAWLKHSSNGTKCGSENVCRVVDKDRYTTEPHYFCSLLTKLSCLSSTNMMPALFEQYADIGIFLALCSLFGCFMYFIASSDSGSLVDSMLAANGLPEPSRIQRLYWSLTEGAAASALLYAGRFMPHDDDAQLKALQAVSIVIGLPWTILICLECLSLWRACEYECGDRKWGGGFRTSIVDVGITAFQPQPGTGRMMNCGRGKLDTAKLVDVLLNCFVPPRSIYQILTEIQKKVSAATGATGSNMKATLLTVLSAFLYFAWLLLICLDHIPTDECGYWEAGSNKGLDGNTLKKYSTRYGVFHGWGVDIEKGAVIATRANSSDTWSYVGVQKCNGLHMNMFVGKRIGSTMRIAVFGWFSLWLFIAIVAYLRATVRTMYKKNGNPIEDFLCSFVAWPTALSQMKDCLMNEEIPCVEKSQKELPSHDPTKQELPPQAKDEKFEMGEV